MRLMVYTTAAGPMVVDRDTRKITGPFQSGIDAWDYICDLFPSDDDLEAQVETAPSYDDQMDNETDITGDIADAETFHA